MTVVYFDICDLFNSSSFFKCTLAMNTRDNLSIRFKCAINLILPDISLVNDLL